ncbi:MAG: hypothetical protein K6G88_05095 [Lachnospiraceae bacterium]|nr:hypothetical protein [Lachnospiraceae bacterium]
MKKGKWFNTFVALVMTVCYIASNITISDISASEYLYISAGETLEITSQQRRTDVIFIPSVSGTYNFYSTHEDSVDPWMNISLNSSQIASGDDEEGTDFYVSAELTAGEEYLLKCFISGTGSYTLHVEMEGGNAELGIKDLELSISEERPFLVKDMLYDGDVEVGYIRPDDGLFRFVNSIIKEMIVLTVVYEDDSAIQWHYTEQNKLLNKKTVTFEIPDTAQWSVGGDNIVTVTYEGITKSISIPVKDKLSIEIEGVSISPISEGARTVYTISDCMGQVQEVGLVYGLKKYIHDDDLYVGNDSNDVYDYKGTSKGKLSNQNENDEYTTTYAMTMLFGNVNKLFFDEPISVRAYAKLSDGTFVYSDVVNFKIFDVASYLYDNKMMPTQSGHEYLFNKILKPVDINYSEIQY